MYLADWNTKLVAIKVICGYSTVPRMEMDSAADVLFAADDLAALEQDERKERMTQVGGRWWLVWL